jgi:hypothetical protein
LTASSPDLPKLMYLYSVICRMRTSSSHEVLEAAQKTVHNIVNSYPQENKSFSDLRRMMNEGALDPLREFSEACRMELQGRHAFWWRERPLLYRESRDKGPQNHRKP